MCNIKHIAFLRQYAGRLKGFLYASFGEADIDPPGKAVLMIPPALTVTY
jgi:hypothetical protein